MSTPTTPASLIEVSKVAISFLSDVSKSLPFLFGCLAASVFLVFMCPSDNVKGISATAAIFFITYLVVLRWVGSRNRHHTVWNLKHIARDEQIVLQRYLKENRAVCYFSVFHGPSASLIGKGILSHATSSFPYDDAPVVIQPFILVHLQKHPELIGLKPEDVGATKLRDELNEYGESPGT